MIKRPTYEEYDEYIYDYDTTNASFIAMASILYRKGIENYNFFLKLYDEDLVGVDPYAPDVSSEYKLKIVFECRRNFWYFIREVFIIPGVGRYKLHRGNLAASWCFLNNIPTYEVLPRQQGKTWAVIAYALWVFNFGAEYTNMLFMNKQAKDSQMNLKRLKDARYELPDYLRFTASINDKGELKEGRSNVTTLDNGLTKNNISATSSARNPISADELGRGMTVAWVWIDELAFVQFNRIIYAAMAPAHSKAAEVAIAHGRPTGKILTTTPGDLSNDAGMFAYEIRENAYKFDESLYSMSSEDISTTIDKNCENGYVYIEFMYYQLGLDKKWFDKQCKELLHNWPKIRREVLIQWNNATSNSPFDQDDLKDLRAMQIYPSDDSVTINKYYKLNVYRKLDPNEKYIISVDVAKGRGEKSDRTVVCVTEAKSNKLCAIFKSPIIQYKETYRFLYTLVYSHIPNSVLIIENNIDTLIEYVKNSTMRHMLYFEPVKKVTSETRKKGITVSSNSQNIVYGITTTAQNRPKYFDILFEYVRNNKELICCQEMIEEIECLEYKTDTRIEATAGTHDDVIFAYLIGQYVMLYGTNKARFGIYYADNFGTEYKNISNNVFEHNDIFNSSRELDNSSYTSTSFINPFFAQMLVENDTLDDMERRWKKYRHRQEPAMATATYENNVFGNSTDEVGLSTIDANAFAELNSNYDINDIYDGFGFGNDVDNGLDFMRDIGGDIDW